MNIEYNMSEITKFIKVADQYGMPLTRVIKDYEDILASNFEQDLFDMANENYEKGE